MYCQKCGWKAESESTRFCQKCGSKLINEADSASAMDIEESQVFLQNEEVSKEKITSRENVRKQNGLSLLWSIVAPVASFLLASSIGYYYYNLQTDKNNQVQLLQEKAEKAALSGDYEEALGNLEKAAEIRPSYSLLAEMEALILTAMEFKENFDNIEDLIKKQNLDEADTEVARLKELLHEQEGPLFSGFKDEISEKESHLSIAKTRKDIEHLNTVEQLGAELHSLSSVNHEDKDEVAKLIKDKIVNITINEAQLQMNDKQFSNAIELVNEALHYASGDEKLLSFQERIVQEQSAYEEAERNRIEQAIMVAAAQEDLKNKTAAVNVESLDVYIDEFGDLHVSGTVKNTASVPIFSIELYYSVYDSEGIEIGSDRMYADPYDLKPGAVGTFNELYSSVYEEITVEITKAVWKLK